MDALNEPDVATITQLEDMSALCDLTAKLVVNRTSPLLKPNWVANPRHATPEDSEVVSRLRGVAANLEAALKSTRLLIERSGGTL